MKTIFKAVVLIVIYILVFAQNVEADSLTEETENLDDYEFNDIQSYIDNDESIDNVDFYETVKEIMKGKGEDALDKIFRGIKQAVAGETIFNYKDMKQIIVIAIIAAIFTNFANILKNGQISETGFMVSYILIISAILISFGTVTYIVCNLINRILDFMNALLPVYMVSCGVCIGQAGAMQFYRMALIMITAVNIVCLKIIIPIVDIYVVIGVINNISKVDYLSKTNILLKSIVTFMVKTMFMAVMGINVIQSMLIPVSSNIRNNAAKNVICAVSGMGNSVNGITELIYGTGNIIRSAIGTAGEIVLCMILIVPVVKIILIILSYRITSVIIQPVSDKRISNCMEILIDGTSMLLKTVFMCSVMFAITIAIVCMVRA